MHLDELKRHLIQNLAAISDDAQFEARQILMFALNLDTQGLILKGDEGIDSAKLAEIEGYLKRRLNNEPLAYILGRWQFRDLDLKVTSSTLIPRPETELIIDIIKEQVVKKRCNVLELGTGTGAIALAIKNEIPSWLVMSTDICSKALEVAKENARNNGNLEVEFFKSDWWQDVPKGRLFDVVISNPPYIDCNDAQLDASVREFEPALALFAKHGGMEAIETIISGSVSRLKTNGFLLLEHGYLQGKTVRSLLIQEGFNHVQSYLDQYQNERFTSGLMV